MKFTIMSGDFLNEVAWAAHALPKRAYTPVLNGILIEADNDAVTFSAFDYDASRRTVVELDAPIDPGRVLVPGRLLVDVTKALPKGELVDVAADDRETVIRCGRSEYVIPLMPIDDYPALPQPPDVVGSVSSKMLGYAVAATAVAAGTDPVVPMLTGVHLEASDGLINLSATDRYRIAWRTISWSPALDTEKVEAHIPAKVLADIARGLPDTTVQVCVDDKLAAFVAANRTTTIRLLDEEFIDVPAKFAGLEKTTKVVAAFDADELAKVVKRVSLMATRSAPVRLSFGQGSVLVEAGDRSEGRASEQMDCQLDGDDIQVAFTVSYLLDVLGAFGGPVQLHAPTIKDFGAKPVQFRRGTDHDDYRHMLMPVRLNG